MGSRTTTYFEAEPDEILKKERALIEKLEPEAAKVCGKPTPDTFLIGRGVHRYILSAKSEIFEGKVCNITTELFRFVSDVDYLAAMRAIAHTLYVQSYQSGNKNTNSGIGQPEKAERQSAAAGQTMYVGKMVVALNDLTQRGYGEVTTQKRRAMERTLDAVHAFPVKITFPNGNELEITLCARMAKFKRKADRAICYVLYANPVFCALQRNFIEEPQETMKELAEELKRRGEKITKQHYLLIDLICGQRKGKPFVRYIETLVDELEMTADFREHRGRTEKRILGLLATMKAICLIKAYQVDFISERGRAKIHKITCQICTPEEMTLHTEKMGKGGNLWRKGG